MVLPKKQTASEPFYVKLASNIEPAQLAYGYLKNNG